MNVKKLLVGAAAVAMTTLSVSAQDRTPADLNDLEIAHVAYIADNIDIRYAHLALAISTNEHVREFANTMIRDHEAVNEQALALLGKLKANPQDNFLSQALNKQADELVDKMSKLRGQEFDEFYAKNELGYHQAVNSIVGEQFIPNIENAEVKALFKAGLNIFEGHEKHAEMMVKAVVSK